MNSMKVGSPSILFRAVQGIDNETLVCELPAGSVGAGGRFVLLSLISQEVQRAYLNAAGRRFPVTCDGNKLEAVFPYWEGQAFSAWEAQTKPRYKELRRICLQILQGLLEEQVSEELFVRMLARDNICICHDGARLQYFLDFSEKKRWSGPVSSPNEREIGGADPLPPYTKLAAFFYDLLNTAVGMTSDNESRCPAEYRLLRERAIRREYHTSVQLFRDLNTLPEDFSLRCPVSSLIQLVKDRQELLLRRVADATLLLMAVAAVLCVVTAASQGTETPEGDGVFSGIVQIGDQILTGK